MRYTADETWSAANRSRRQTELRQIAGWSDCQLTADALRLQKHCAYQKGILVQRKRAPESVDGKVVDENVFPPGQGYLPKLMTKMNEMPTTFESSVVK